MNQYINLVDKLTEHDKEVIETYITTYGCDYDNFVGVSAWLESWSRANQKLYHLLGDSLIKEFPYTYKKDDIVLTKEFYCFIQESSLKYDYHNFYNNYIKKQDWIDANSLTFFNKLFNVENFLNESVSCSLKIKKPNAKKMLQIQVGTKPLKAIGRVISYFKEDYPFNETTFEEFKKEYAIIESEKTVTGKFCISIHPMDFLTMSDNNSNWTSCMNWKNEGCYHVGTIEMMNSNNVVCAYLLHGNNQFVFNKDAINPDTGEIIGIWNNKRWRQLFYITKDIICCGKPYPYIAKDLTLTILDQIKVLAKDNLNWNYQYGPELYRDMIHINTTHHMSNQREWMYIERMRPQKHNIIWDTKGMYNDMLNDNNTEYWCYRNKVKHTKILSVSGKTNCLCCNNSILDEKWDYEDYNDRYDNTESAICKNCLEEYYHCDYCNNTFSSRKTKLFTLKNGNKICEYCLRSIKICPECGDFICNNSYIAPELNGYYFNNSLYEAINKQSVPKNRDYRIYYPEDILRTDLDDDFQIELIDNNNKKTIYNFEPVFIHRDCYNKIADEIKENAVSVSFNRIWKDKTFYIVAPSIAEKYRYKNLETPKLENILI